MNGLNMSTVTNYMLGSTQVRNIYYGSTLIWPLHDYSQDYLTFEAIDTGKFMWNGQTENTIYYSTDNGSTWTTLYGTWNSPGETATINAGDKILLKSNFSGSNPGKFGSTGRFNVMGNIMSLQYGDNFVNQTTLTTEFLALFSGCTQLIDASNLILPATTLISSGYTSMFNGCSSLITAPALPATTLAFDCYEQMFKNCSSLITAPALPATILATLCYGEMFNGCSSLVTAPTLVNYCYQNMFYGCSSLNYIKCLATIIRTYVDGTEEYYILDSTTNWVNGVAATGTFVKAASMVAGNNWATGVSGIPSGWTVQDAS